MGALNKMETTGRWSHRFLPHFDLAGIFQMITYRLADSLPGSTGVPPVSSLLERKRVEELLDSSYGSCLLKEAHFAKIVVDAWKFFDGERYDLIAYVVMPNHVHLLVKEYEEYPLSKIVHSWKSFTAHEIMKVLRSQEKHNTGGTPVLPGEIPEHIWQIEYWDRFIRNEQHFLAAVDYIHMNPEKAGLVQNCEDWLWSSSKEK